ncbi:hypothetical protein D3C72_2573370 [compost metagenome]
MLAQLLDSGTGKRSKLPGFLPTDGTAASRLDFRFNIAQQVQTLVHLLLIHAH